MNVGTKVRAHRRAKNELVQLLQALPAGNKYFARRFTISSMPHELLLENFRRYVALDADEEALAVSLTTSRVFKKGQFINAEGEIIRYTTFITSGSARVFYTDHNGQEHVIQLGIKSWWVGDYPSFITQKPGFLYTEALQPTEILAFSYENMQILYDRVPKMERFFRLITQKAYAAFQTRMLQNLSMDAEQRYLAFRAAYPDLEQQIAQKHIASYLGMSAEFLSKIKKRVLAKKRL